jgi:RNA polymerase sigma factor (sigma-70 family)
MSDVTRILSAIDSGDPHAAEELLPLVYDELRKLAAARLASEKPGQTLQATALVHEAYLRLLGPGTRNQEPGVSEDGGQSQPAPSPQPPAPASFSSRGHFFAAAAEAMRRILVEQARRKKQLQRGGDLERVPLEIAEPVEAKPGEDLVAVDESLARLEAHDPLAARVVKLRYFTGLSMPETAEALGISLRTAERNWTYARTWLHRELG